MILHDINSEDYLYLRLLEKSEDYPFDYTYLEPRTILRFQVEHLRKWIWKRSVFEHLDCFHFEKRENVFPYAYLPASLYKRAVVVKDFNLQISMDSKDILLIDEWLWKGLNSSERPMLTPANQLSFLFGTESSKSPLERNYYHLAHTRLYHYDGEEVVGNSIFEMDTSRKTLPESTLLSLPSPISLEESRQSKLIDCYQFGNECVIVVPLKKGEVIDLRSPVINLLFLNQNYLRLLLNTERVSEQEQLECFKRDFEGFLPTINRRYFKLHDYLKVHSLKEFTNLDVWNEIRKRSSSFQNIFYSDDWRRDQTSLDSEGYVRYVWCKDEPIVEHELSKIATRVSFEEAEFLYNKEQEVKRMKEEESHLQRRAKEYFKKNKARYYKLQKSNPDLSYIDFMMMDSYKKRGAKIENVKRLLLVLNHRIENLKQEE